jgi:hypothetical protein
MIVILHFPFNLNESLQVGDTVYFTTTTTNSSVTSGSIQPSVGNNIISNSSNLIKLGEVLNIGFGQSELVSGGTQVLTTLLPDVQLLQDPVQHIELKLTSNSVLNDLEANSMILFVKNSKVNVSSIKGYYASAKFINNSTEKAELFCVNANVSKSS